MFKKILCPVDFSKYTENIIAYAVEISKKFNSELHLLHVIPNLSYFTPYESFMTPENIIALERNIEKEIEKDFEKISKKSIYPIKR